MGTYNASAYNDNHTLLKLILNIQDYLHKNPNVALYHTVGFQGTVATTSIPKDKVYGPVGSTNTPTAGDLILYALDLGQGFFQVGGADENNYIGEYIGQTLTGPKGDPGPEGPEGPEGPAGTPGVKLYYTTGFQGTVATTSIPKDKVHGPTGSTTTPIIGDVILYALDLGQGYFMVSGADASNYIGSYIGQTVQGEKGDPGTPGAAATIAIGTVTTGDPTTPAAVSNVGTENAAVFNFTIPRGEKGDKGSDGANPFYITCTESGNAITADKTWAEIKAAYSAGQVIAVKVGTGVLPLMSADVTGDTGSFLFGYTTVSADNKEIHTKAISYTHTTTDTWANADYAHNDDAIYTAIQSLFVYDEPTKTLNIIPYGGGS